MCKNILHVKSFSNSICAAAEKKILWSKAMCVITFVDVTTDYPLLLLPLTTGSVQDTDGPCWLSSSQAAAGDP